MKKILVILLTLMSFTFASAIQLKVVTEELPPYSYMEGAKVKGMATDVVRSMLKKVKIYGDIKVLPWKQAYKVALSEPNVIIYSIIRTPERENLFKWVGEIKQDTYSFYALKEKKELEVNKLEDMKAYKIAVNDNSAIFQYLLNKKFSASADRMKLSTNYYDCLHKLFSKEVDIIPLLDFTAKPLTKKLGYKESSIKKVYKIDEMPVAFYIACSVTTDDQIVSKLKDALAQLKKSGGIEKIIRKYSK